MESPSAFFRFVKRVDVTFLNVMIPWSFGFLLRFSRDYLCRVRWQILGSQLRTAGMQGDYESQQEMIVGDCLIPSLSENVAGSHRVQTCHRN